MPVPPIAILVLAAGGSTRMGSAKQLLTYDGLSLLRRAATVAVATGCRPAIVVLGRDAGRLRSELDGLDVTAVDNLDWPTGMGGSIRTGVEAALKLDPGVSGIAVTLADQPHVDAAAVAMLIARFRQSAARAVTARYAGTVGVPAVFGPSLFLTLGTLDPAAGAKQLLTADGVLAVDLPAAAVDVDTPDDYRQLCRPAPPPI